MLLIGGLGIMTGEIITCGNGNACNYYGNKVILQTEKKDIFNRTYIEIRVFDTQTEQWSP